MRTQSVDTHPDAERIMIELIRSSPMSRRIRLVQSLTQSAFWATIHTWQECHRESSEQEAAMHALSCSYGPGLAKRVQAALERRECWHLQPVDLLAVMHPAWRALEDLHMPYYLGGSIASSLHGMQQLAQDIDLVVDLGEQVLPSLFTVLRQHYLFNEGEARKAVRVRTSFPLIHLDSLMKVDVVLPKPEAFDTFMRQLIRCYTLDEHYPPIPLASATEMLLFKVQRYQRDERSRTDGRQDDAEWNDILGMLKVQGPDLDLPLLEEWAGALAMTDTWHRALVDAGLRGA
jgi:hypothetical protein